MVRARAGTSRDADTRIVGDHVYVTIHVPEIRDEQLRYAIRQRYIVVWGDDARQDEHHFILLPRRVDPDQHSVRFRNGVFDARIRIREAP